MLQVHGTAPEKSLVRKKGDINEKDITVEYSDDQYTVVVPVSFEKNKANFTYVFDKSGTPTSLTVDVNYTLAQNMDEGSHEHSDGSWNRICDPGIPDLRDLSFQIYSRTCGRKEKRERTGSGSRSSGAVLSAPVAEPAVEDVTDDGELIAVIAAAIAASEGKTSTDGFVVRSIRKVNRRKR